MSNLVCGCSTRSKSVAILKPRTSLIENFAPPCFHTTFLRQIWTILPYHGHIYRRSQAIRAMKVRALPVPYNRKIPLTSTVWRNFSTCPSLHTSTQVCNSNLSPIFVADFGLRRINEIAQFFPSSHISHGHLFPNPVLLYCPSARRHLANGLRCQVGYNLLIHSKFGFMRLTPFIDNVYLMKRICFLCIYIHLVIHLFTANMSLEPRANLPTSSPSCRPFNLSIIFHFFNIHLINLIPTPFLVLLPLATVAPV